MRKFLSTLVLWTFICLVFTITLTRCTSAFAEPKEGPVFLMDVPAEYAGYYQLKGKLGGSGMLEDGLNTPAPTCHPPKLRYQANFTLENSEGVAVVNEMELAHDYLFSLTRLFNGIKLGHTLIKRGHMLQLRFLEIEKKGSKVKATGYLIHMDEFSGEIYCANTLKMSGTFKKYK